MEYGAIDLHTKESEIRIIEAGGGVVLGGEGEAETDFAEAAGLRVGCVMGSRTQALFV